MRTVRLKIRDAAPRSAARLRALAHAAAAPEAAREWAAALMDAAASGSPKFFLGTDSAPHARHTKEADCGCATGGTDAIPWLGLAVALVFVRRSRAIGGRSRRSPEAR